MARLESNNFPELNKNILAKLHSQNIYTVYDFMLHMCDDLMKQTGFGFKKVQEMKESFLRNFGGEIMNSIDVYEQEKEDVIPTGIKNLDRLLDGGLHYRNIYEICGSSSSGKSQLCHWISTYATMNTSTEVHYIDGSRNFCITRIQMILEEKQCSDNTIGKVMSNIKVHQVYKINDLLRIFHHLSKMPRKEYNESTKKLVIVDSLSVLCRRIPNNELHLFLSNFASVCRFLVNNFRSVVINVNTIKLEHREKVCMKNNKNLNANFQPALGNYWLCIPNIRLLLTYLENTQREISVWNSCQLEIGKKCFIDIKSDGIL